MRAGLGQLEGLEESDYILLPILYYSSELLKFGKLSTFFLCKMVHMRARVVLLGW